MSIFFFPLDWQALNPETLECSAFSFKVMNTQNPDNSVIHQGEILLICTNCMSRLNGSISRDLSRIFRLVNLFKRIKESLNSHPGFPEDFSGGGQEGPLQWSDEIFITMCSCIKLRAS